MSNLSDKIIVVTGGSGLIGRALINHIRQSGGVAINAEISVESDLTNHLVHIDVTDEQSVKQAIAEVLNAYGRIDGWVNNAYPRTNDWGKHFEEIPAASWQKNVDLQLNSVFICCQQILASMKTQGFGSVVNISSIYGTVGPDFTVYNDTQMTMPAAYSAIKGGVVNFSRYLASYFGPHGLRINCVSPGGIFDHQNETFVDQYEQKVPLRRMGNPEDIAPAVSFLLSDEAGYITGHNLMVDGGWTAI
jgi:NAD(P)-dependent dehydrogenase (short-subunit alcohol dehydrogenase family)